MIHVHVPYYYYHPVDWNAINKAQARESNEKYFKYAEEVLLDKIRATGLFNIFSFQPLGLGVKCYLTSRKYPNVYAMFELSENNITNQITFECYIHEKKLVRFDVSLIQFLSMVGFHGPKIKWKWWEKLFLGCRDAKPSEPLVSIKQFEDLMERAIQNQGYRLEPFKFHLEYSTRVYDWDVEEAKKYSEHPEVLLYTLSKPTENHPVPDVVQHKIRYDQRQWFLLQNFVKEGGKISNYN